VPTEISTPACRRNFVPSAAANLLADLAAALTALRLRWYVFGAQAVVVHGRPRLTEDVDVTVELGKLSAQQLVAQLQRHEFQISDVADDEFVAATRVIPFTHQPTGMALDVVLAGPGLEELFLDCAEETDLGGIIVPVISVEHLLVTKILAGRNKDLDDARDILRGRDDVNVIAIRSP
jgi:hypothetical protein